MATSTISGLLNNISTSDDKLAALQELKTVLAQVTAASIKDVIQNLSVDVIFQCMHSKNRDEAEVSRDVLKRLFEAMEPSVVISQYNDQLSDGLKSPSDPVKEFSLAQVLRCVETDTGSRQILTSSVDVIYQCIHCIGDEEISIAKEAIQILTCLGKSQAGLEFLFQQSVIKELRKVMEINDTVRYRMYELIVNIIQLSSQALEYCSNSGLIDQLMLELEGDDILVQVNCIEMLTHITNCQHGLHYLDQHGIMTKLETMMTSSEGNPLINFLMPGLIKFFGNVARYEPSEVFEKYPMFTGIIFSLISSTDPAQKGVVLDTVGLVGSTVAGKLVLNKQGQAMEDAVRELGSAIQQPPTEMRVRAISAVSYLLHIEMSEQTEDILSLTEKWFQQLSSKPMDVIMSLCKQPFLEIRCGAFNMLESIANQTWAQRQMNEHPAFAEYLLDRSTEHEKSGKEMKYSIVKALVESSTTGEVFGRPYLLRLKEYLREGPFYVRVQSEVAMEGST
ncbi:26S proteasome non-ATPase regulatory subunit 5-like [Glandiceps talaboti]